MRATIEILKLQLASLAQQQSRDKKLQKSLPHDSDEARNLRATMVDRRLRLLKPLNRTIQKTDMDQYEKGRRG